MHILNNRRDVIGNQEKEKYIVYSTVFLTNDRVSINCLLSPKIRVAVIKIFRKIVEKCP